MENNTENHKLFKVNQNAAIRNNMGSVLILKKDGRWMLPGGRMENDETWLGGLQREVKEETGIEDFSVKEILNVDISDSGNTYIVTFLCALEGALEVKLSSEHQDYAWLKIEDIEKYEFSYEKIKERLKLLLLNEQ